MKLFVFLFVICLGTAHRIKLNIFGDKIPTIDDIITEEFAIFLLSFLFLFGIPC